MSSMDWRSLVSTDERLTSILRIAELAHAVQPFNEVLNRARQAEAGVFQRATSRENYTASMEQLVSYMKKTIEDKTKQHLEQLAEKEYKELSDNQTNDLAKNSKTEEQSDQLTKKQLELKNLWKKRIEEIMEQLRRQQQTQSQRLYLLLQNLQLQQLLQQKKTRQTQSTNITPFLQQEVLLPQPSVSVLQTNLSTIQQSINPLFQQQPTIIFQQQQTIPQFYQPQTYSFQHQPMTVQQLFTLTQPSFTVQPLITHQALPNLSTPLKCEQSQSLPQDTSYYLVKDANIHKEAFKEALKLPINEQKRHPPPGEPVIPVHALKVEGSDTASQVQLHHQFK
ncbi:hypothetical protein RhiirA5_352649 [Rhizophagus irregularis]|uniref:Mediator of RNA polymerase II transcription subunit 15 n=2 Tax=Rhizophagus irregularis TaxID=588596 RepID=A0A2I1EEB7_9GLOM|nr:hypothetical protein RirG_257250 [Rhizophagus irregularis DAOM 197198w]PKC12678.1 hypothetical protein RhiirA5_352649 [Rhizophagus irregularis]EXX51969.1 hypothetical protein RirG_257250 [Rhizophagus irregularis DAOM 197198w]EXX51970.1 hypothetical protein RirG_257250 [Rhizophagus irregularis DAOM 197198w]PKC71373.1 hypothetical protein RhiirA1_413288 [Rhizophagus irregularis]